MERFNLSRVRVLNWAAIGCAVLQSVCALALLVGSVGTLVGVSLLAALGGLMRAAVAFHADGVRLPMLGLAAVGALLNLWVLARLRRLRANPAGAWRRREADPKQLGRERLQLLVAGVTLALIALEMGLHLHNHGHI